MRQAQVPEDMTSDMKNILGVMSTRQLIYLIVGASVLYAYIPFVFQLVSSFVTSIILCLVSAVPVVAIVGLLGFVENNKHKMYYDKYLKILFFKKMQKGNWRK